MPQGSSISPGWFVKAINEVIKRLHQVATYLERMIVFESDPKTHVKTINALIEQIRKHNLKLPPSTARLGGTDADFLGHRTSPAGVHLNAEKVSALRKRPMPRNLKQVRIRMGGVRASPTFLHGLFNRIRPIAAHLRKGVEFEFTLTMEVAVRKILAELTTPPILVFPDWTAVVDGSRPVHVYCDAYFHGFGAALKQEQPDGSSRLSPTSVGILSIPRGTGPRSIWKLAAFSGPSNDTEATFKARSLPCFRIKRRSRAPAK